MEKWDRKDLTLTGTLIVNIPQTHPVQQSISWEVNIFSATQKFPTFTKPIYEN
jgi:hypothetical protein